MDHESEILTMLKSVTCFHDKDSCADPDEAMEQGLNLLDEILSLIGFLEPLVVGLEHLSAPAGNDGLKSGGDRGHHSPEHPDVSVHLLPDCVDGISEFLLGLRVATLDIVLQDGPNHLYK